MAARRPPAPGPRVTSAPPPPPPPPPPPLGDALEGSPPPSRTWAEVDLGAVRHNVRALRRRAGIPLMAVVKADAYGHRAAPPPPPRPPRPGAPPRPPPRGRRPGGPPAPAAPPPCPAPPAKRAPTPWPSSP